MRLRRSDSAWYENIGELKVGMEDKLPRARNVCVAQQVVTRL